jgi:hypothetical protein
MVAAVVSMYRSLPRLMHVTLSYQRPSTVSIFAQRMPSPRLKLSSSLKDTTPTTRASNANVVTSLPASTFKLFHSNQGKFTIMLKYILILALLGFIQGIALFALLWQVSPALTLTIISCSIGAVVVTIIGVNAINQELSTS